MIGRRYVVLLLLIGLFSLSGCGAQSQSKAIAKRAVSSLTAQQVTGRLNSASNKNPQCKQRYDLMAEFGNPLPIKGLECLSEKGELLFSFKNSKNTKSLGVSHAMWAEIKGETRRECAGKNWYLLYEPALFPEGAKICGKDDLKFSATGPVENADPTISCSQDISAIVVDYVQKKRDLPKGIAPSLKNIIQEDYSADRDSEKYVDMDPADSRIDNILGSKAQRINSFCLKYGDISVDK